MCTACRYIGSAKERTAWKSSSWMERSQRVMIPSLMLSEQVCGSGVSRGDLRRLAAKSPASSHSPVIRNRATIDRIRPILMAIRTTELFISLPVPLPGALEQGLEHLVEGDDLRRSSEARSPQFLDLSASDPVLAQFLEFQRRVGPL